MKKILLRTLWVFGVLVVSVPACFVITFTLSPLWSWIEERYGIESMGHSGPADWCFWTVYAFVVAVLLLISWLFQRVTPSDGLERPAKPG